ncbi:MAG: acyl-CoA desaturase [Rhizobiaceae bacterium]
MASQQTLAIRETANDLNWVNVIGIGFFHLVALLAVFPIFFSWTGLALAFLGNYIFGTLGINLFYHRYLTHKGFKCPRWLECTLAVLAVCCFQESPAQWVSVHRRHHEYSDEDPDPHSPIRGFFWAHIGWILVKPPEESRRELYSRYAKDILRDPFYRKLEKHSVYIGIIALQCVVFFGAGVIIELMLGGTWSAALLFGSSLLIWGVFVRTVFVWHATWSVNSITHIWGYQNYDTGENSRNNIFIGYLTNGEGWHNNHHADPRSSRHGHRPLEFDLTYWTIRFLGMLGLATHIRDTHLPKTWSTDKG